MLGGCGSGALPREQAVVPAPPPPDREVARVTDLLTAVGLRWAVLLSPAELVGTSWLAPAIQRLVDDERWDALATTTGIDVRVAPRIVLAGYEDDGEETVAYFVRHRAEPALVERKFRARLTDGLRRRELGHQLVTVWGRIGRRPHGHVSVGPDVAGFQYGGDADEGPLRVAALYARGRLGGIPTLLEDEALGALARALGAAPALLLLPGPFSGELSRGARGLFAGAVGLGLSLAPTDQQSLAARALLSGDYGHGPDLERALDFAAMAWNDVARSDLGHLLGLGEPVSPPEARAHPLGLELTVELDPARLANGLAAATMDEVETIMR